MKGRHGALALMLLVFCCWKGSTAERIVNTQMNSTDEGYLAHSEVDHPFLTKAYIAVANAFVDLVQSKQILPAGALIVRHTQSGREIAETSEASSKFLVHFLALVILSIVLLLLAVTLPCVGCCCFGGKTKWPKDYHDLDTLRSRKNTMSFVLLFVFLLLAFGCVFAGVSNQDQYTGVKELPDYLGNTIHDFSLYIKNVVNDLRILFRDNFQEVSANILLALDTAGEKVIDTLSESAEMLPIQKIDGFVTTLENIKQDLTSIDANSTVLKTQASDLDSEFNRIQNELIQTLTQCGDQCKDMKEKVEAKKLNTADEFKKLPVEVVRKSLATVNELYDNGIVDNVNAGKKEFEDIQTKIQREVNERIPKAAENLDVINEKLDDTFINSSRKLNEIFLDFIDDDFEPFAGKIKSYVRDNSIYGYTYGWIITVIQSVVALLVLLGVLYGINDKNCGPSLLKAAIWLIFYITSVLTIINVLQMNSSILTDRAVCQPLRNPEGNRLIQLVDELLDFSDFEIGEVRPPQLTIGGILNSCHENKALIKVLKLDEITKVDKWLEDLKISDINNTINELKEKIKLDGDYELLSDGAKQQLDDLANSKTDKIDFDAYREILNKTFTSFDLKEYAADLRKFASKLNAKLKQEVEVSAGAIEKCQEDYVEPMTSSCRQLTETVANLKEEIKFNDTSMRVAIGHLKDGLRSAQDWINTNATDTVHRIATELGVSLYARITDFVEHVAYSLRDNVGKCGPLSGIYNSTIVAGCDKLLDPYKGFWLSNLWCLILFIPVVIFSNKLIDLQKQSSIASKFGLNNDRRPRLDDEEAHANGRRDDASSFNRHSTSRASKYY